MKQDFGRQLPYNTEKDPLIIPEYGRHVHKMVEYAKTIEEKEKRNKVAKSIIDVMGNLSPHLRDVTEFQHKLWDQLFIISNFELDIESPYEKITKEVFEKRPEPLKYPQSRPRYRFYGSNIPKIIAKIDTVKEQEDKKIYILSVANHMKKCYLTWNKDTVEDSIIITHLQEFYGRNIDEELLPKELQTYEELNIYPPPRKNLNNNNGKKKNWKNLNNNGQTARKSFTQHA